MSKTCDGCAYFDQTHHLVENESVAVAGYCRRYAPVPPGTTQKLDYHEPDKPRLTQWPIVPASAWCGEYASSAKEP